MKRFRETGQRLYQFSHLFLVHCPRCDGCAKVVLKDQDAALVGGKSPYRDTYLFAPRRLVCTRCGYVKDWHGKQLGSDGLQDWYFQQPLWLQIPCCGEALWAWNKEHLYFLEEYIAAGLRETFPRGTLANRLPRWMTSAKNREEVLKGIRKLREMLE